MDVIGFLCLPLGIKCVPAVEWPGREADHPAPTSVEVNKTWIYTSTAPYVFIV
jgi:hypothetical protein